VIKRFNARYRDSKVSIKFSSQERPSISPDDRNFFKVVSRAVEETTGRRARFCLMPGATDLRYFMWKGVPALGYSARGGETWHSDNEFVYIDSLIDTAKVYASVMTKLR
ncbi:MAG: M20/M25/M40 family metallo-hydrolase, partial [Proteobacteria bacterium]|nr:M20/M25/M40 family metallo-hydrolase [Pseudomonadota bacterium]